MSYLQDRKKRNKKIRNIFLVFLFLIFFIYFSSPVFNFLSSSLNKVSRPFLILTNNIGARMYNFSVLFADKKTLILENQNLKNELNEQKSLIEEYNILAKEVIDLKEILGRVDENKEFVLATILKKPGIFDTLILDIGEDKGIKETNLVFAYGNIPIGYVKEVYPKSSLVYLFSKTGEKVNALVQSRNIYLDVIGRGGGNFEIILPRDLVLEKGENLLLPNLKSYTIAKVDSIISDPRDSFQKALLISPINIQELRFVEVELN